MNWRLVGGLCGLASVALGVVAELSVLLPSGAIGEPTRKIIALAVGWAAPLLPLWPIVLGLLAVLKALRPGYRIPRGRIWSAALACLALIGLAHLLPLGGPGGLA